MKNKGTLIVVIFAILLTGFFVYKNYKEEREVFSYPDKNIFLRIDKIRDIKIKKKHIDMPDSVRAIYISSWIGGNKKYRGKLLDFIEASRINAIILDIKDYSGELSFKMNHELIQEYQTSGNRINDIGDFIGDIHDRGIYLIGRVTTFQDPLLAKRKPEFAFKRKDNGKVWKDRKGLAFIDPQKEDAWAYYVAIAEESYGIGFDEINFDYIRYPSDGNIKNLNYNLGGNTKLQAMKKFYEYLDKELRSQEIPISADLFGFVASMENGIPVIGQKLTDALPYFDAIAPMVYPSHYPKKYLGFSNSAEHPYEVVFHEMNLAREKAIGLGLPETSLRTWIQDFDMGATYGFDKIQAQIKASYDARVPSYMVWDPNNSYTKKAYYKNFLENYEKEKQQL